MKIINAQLNRSINYTEDPCKILYLIKLNMEVYVIFLLNIWKKLKFNIFYKHEYKDKFNF